MKKILLLLTLLSVLFFATERTSAYAEVEGVKPKGPTFSFALGAGMLSGDTTYRIGGTFVDSVGNSAELHFPISELKFPLDVYMVSLEASADFTERWSLSAGVKKNVTGDAGKMKDSDWGYYWLDGCSWCATNTLDIYSESDADLDALILDVNLRYKYYEVNHENKMHGITYEEIKWSYWIGLGLIYQNFDYEISNLDQWYPSDKYYFGTDSPHDRLSGRVLTYEVTSLIPYLEYVAMLDIKNKFRMEARLGYSPIVNVKDEDHHLLRSKINKGDSDGSAILLSLKGRYNFLKNFFSTFVFDYTKVKAEGKSKAYVSNVYNHTIDLQIESNQLFAGIALGYAF